MTKRSSLAAPKKDLKSGLWYFVFDSVEPKPDGSRRQIRRRNFKTQAEAKDELDRLLREDRALQGRDVPTVDEVLDRFIRAKKVQRRAPNTIAFHEWAAGLARSRWGAWQADRLTHDHVEAAYAAMLEGGRRVKTRSGTITTEKPMSARSVEAMHKTLKAAYALAVNKGELIRNPLAVVSPPPVTEQKHTWWTPDEVGRFLTFIRDLEAETPATKPKAKPGEKRRRAGLPLPVGTIETFADTGGRRGEVLGLRWSDVDLVDGTANVSQQLAVHARTKTIERRPTKRPRSKCVIALHPDTVAALRRRKAQQAADRLLMGSGWPRSTDPVHGDLIFTDASGRAIQPDVLTSIITRLSEQSGLGRLTTHGLRHSFATAALKARQPVEVVAARLGNTARVVQETYAHVIPADDAQLARVVGDLYRSAADR